ncbi:MAG: discoidin domain-containing protein [Desulfohalobium sp.]
MRDYHVCRQVEGATPQAVQKMNLEGLLRFVDKFNRNALPAALFEARVGKGSLFVSTLDIASELDNRPAAARLRVSVLDYIASDKFQPTGSLTQDQLKALFGKPRLTASANSQHPDYPALNEVDGDTGTIWHSDWNHQHGPPFELTLELPEEETTLGFRYVPRQDNASGRIAEYQIEVGTDEEQWTQQTPRQSFARGTATVELMFEQGVRGKYLRMRIFSSQDGRPMASAATFLPLLQADAMRNLDVRDLGIIPGFNDQV